MKNIIFDIGHVLLHQEVTFVQYLQGLGLEHEESKLICNTIFGEFFDAPLWSEFDRGTVLAKDIIADAVEKLPQYEAYITKLLACWTDTFVPIEDTVEILYELRQNGYKIYLLSNFSGEGFLQVQKRYEFLKAVNGGVISYEVKSVKPEGLIYETLIKQYNLVPETCLFIDDRQANIDKAIEFGIDGICFVEDGSLRGKLLEKGIQLSVQEDRTLAK
ncbi:MAG: HAD family hydrolase [Cellulosilyticaceae bacterium]